jgi:hypothetical protein
VSTEEREPAALTAKFTGIRHPKTGKVVAEGPFRVVVIRDGGTYRSFLAPTGQKLCGYGYPLGKAQQKAESFFTSKVEDWTECDKSKGIPV